jgi:prenyl protein peptidase
MMETITNTKIIAVTYCIVISLSFVLSLYIIVPGKIRALPRNDVRHVKARLVAVTIVSFMSVAIFGRYCDTSGSENTSLEWTMLVGFSWNTTRDLAVLRHSIQLFIGPIVTSSIATILDWHVATTSRQRSTSGGLSPIQNIIASIKYLGWIDVRDFLAAPAFEELVFRGCMTWPLLSSGFTAVEVTFLAPIFFGVAHVHHAIVKLQSGVQHWTVVMSVTVLQFTYTSMFGWYSTYAFLRTGSILSVIMSHSFCNIMGFPSLSFMKQPPGGNRDKVEDRIYGLRFLLLAAYAFGIVLFTHGFSQGRTYDDQGGLLAFQEY